MSLKPIELTEDEKKQLRFRSENPSPDLPSKRPDIILLHNAGRSITQIEGDVGMCAINVRKWVHRYKKAGIEGLRSGMSTGRPPLFNDEQKAEFIRLWRMNPYALGLRFKRWSLQRLRVYVMEKKIVDQISVETLRQIVGHKVLP